MSVHDLRLISASLDLLVAEIIPEPEQPTDVTGATGSPGSPTAGRRISMQLLRRTLCNSNSGIEMGTSTVKSSPKENIKDIKDPTAQRVCFLDLFRSHGLGAKGTASMETVLFVSMCRPCAFD